MKTRGVYVKRGPGGLLVELQAVGMTGLPVRRLIAVDGSLTHKDVTDMWAALNEIDPHTAYPSELYSGVI